MDTKYFVSIQAALSDPRELPETARLVDSTTQIVMYPCGVGHQYNGAMRRRWVDGNAEYGTALGGKSKNLNVLTYQCSHLLSVRLVGPISRDCLYVPCSLVHF